MKQNHYKIIESSSDGEYLWIILLGYIWITFLLCKLIINFWIYFTQFSLKSSACWETLLIRVRRMLKYFDHKKIRINLSVFTHGNEFTTAIVKCQILDDFHGIVKSTFTYWWKIQLNQIINTRDLFMSPDVLIALQIKWILLLLKLILINFKYIHTPYN